MNDQGKRTLFGLWRLGVLAISLSLCAMVAYPHFSSSKETETKEREFLQLRVEQNELFDRLIIDAVARLRLSNDVLAHEGVGELDYRLHELQRISPQVYGANPYAKLSVRAEELIEQWLERERAAGKEDRLYPLDLQHFWNFDLQKRAYAQCPETFGEYLEQQENTPPGATTTIPKESHSTSVQGSPSKISPP